MRLARGGVAGLTVAMLLGALALPGTASAHGPVAPVATGYLARIRAAPAGLNAEVIDGYVRMWLRAPARETVMVLDYRGAPYLRFSPAGVAVNRHSEMFYLNMTPVAAVPPASLTARTRPLWSPVSGGHAYEWHDGRLQALASVALAPGTRYVGRWSIPLRVDGRTAAISGGLWHAPRPSPVWFWPIGVILLCVLAGWRLRDNRLDAAMIRVLGGTATIGMAVAAIGLKLHGRPGLAPFNLVELAVILLFAAWAAHRVATRASGPFAYSTIAIVAIWQGLELMPVLWNGFVLIALPSTLARIIAVVCLASGIALLPVAIRLPGAPEGDAEDEHDPEADLGPDEPRESELRA